jgi:sulfoxide reductase heme-binding subunit YedZ
MRAGKNNLFEVGVYAAILGLLLAWRVWRYWQRRTQAQSA